MADSTKSQVGGKSSKSCREETVKMAIKKLQTEKGYQNINVLGRGTYGDVFRMYSPQMKTQVAVKIVTANNISEYELSMWPELDHPNIVPLLDLLTIKPFDVAIFIMPLQMETLHDVLYDKGFLQDPGCLKHLKHWLFQILCGIDYMHNKEVCHLDIKVDNVLITHDFNAMLCDFSFLNETKKPLVRYDLGLPYIYRPPEACQSLGNDILIDGKSYDMWGYGIMVVEIFTHFFLATNVPDCSCWMREVYPVLYQVLQETYFALLMAQGIPSTEVSEINLRLTLNFIHMFLKKDPVRRPTPRLAMQHMFLGRGSKVSSMPDNIWLQRVRYSTPLPMKLSHATPETQVSSIGPEIEASGDERYLKRGIDEFPSEGQTSMKHASKDKAVICEPERSKIASKKYASDGDGSKVSIESKSRSVLFSNRRCSSSSGSSNSCNICEKINDYANGTPKESYESLRKGNALTSRFNPHEDTDNSSPEEFVQDDTDPDSEETETSECSLEGENPSPKKQQMYIENAIQIFGKSVSNVSLDSAKRMAANFIQNVCSQKSDGGKIKPRSAKKKRVIVSKKKRVPLVYTKTNRFVKKKERYEIVLPEAVESSGTASDTCSVASGDSGEKKIPMLQKGEKNQQMTTETFDSISLIRNSSSCSSIVSWKVGDNDTVGQCESGIFQLTDGTDSRWATGDACQVKQTPSSVENDAAVGDEVPEVLPQKEMTREGISQSEMNEDLSEHIGTLKLQIQQLDAVVKEIENNLKCEDCSNKKLSDGNTSKDQVLPLAEEVGPSRSLMSQTLSNTIDINASHDLDRRATVEDIDFETAFRQLGSIVVYESGRPTGTETERNMRVILSHRQRFLKWLRRKYLELERLIKNYPYQILD